MSAAVRSIRFLPGGDSLERQRFKDGEVFWDSVDNTLRVYDGVTKGGFKLATEEYVRTNQNLQDINSDVTPGTANTYSLGSPEKPWKSLYVSTNTIYIGGTAIGVVDGQLTVGDGGTPVNLATEDYVNGQGFITTAALYWNNISSKPLFSTVATSGNYNDLSNKPTIFSGNYNDLTNKPSLFSGSYADLTNKPTLSTVATTGSYTDLSNKPSIPTKTSELSNDSGFITSSQQTAQVQVDWNQTNTDSVDYIKNKPTLFSGSYNDLTNKPSIPSITGLATETYVDTAVSNLVDAAPTTLNTLNELATALGNDANYATTITTALGNKEPTITAGTSSQYWRGDKTWQTLNAAAVSLGNVTNESKDTMFTNPTFTFTSGFLVNYTGGSPARTHFTVDNSNVTVGWVDLTIDGSNGGGNLRFSSGGSIRAIGAGALANLGLGFVGGDSNFLMQMNSANGITFLTGATLQQTSEVLNTKTSATGVVTHDFSTGGIWYHSSLSANFTANFTNVPTTDNRTVVCTLILTQGGSAYIPNAVQIAGVSQTIKWLGGSVPTGNANKVDIVSFTLIRTGSTWTVLGSLSTYG